MFPTPAIRRWSSRNALTGARRPRASARSAAPSSSPPSGSRPTRVAKNASSACVAERQLAGAEAPRVAEAQLVAVVEPDPHPLVGRVRRRGRRGTSRSSAGGVIRKTSSSSSKTSHLPRRASRLDRAGRATASQIACGVERGAPARIRDLERRARRRPATSGARLRRIVSTSGSSGIARPRIRSGERRAREPGLVARRSASAGRSRPTSAIGPSWRRPPSPANRASSGTRSRVWSACGHRRVDAVVGRDDEQVAGPQPREPPADRRVDLRSARWKPSTSLRWP